MKTLFKMIELSEIKKTTMLIIIILGVVSSLFAILPYEIFRSLLEFIEVKKITSMVSYLIPHEVISDNSFIKIAIALCSLYFLSTLMTVILRNLYGFLSTYMTDKLIINIRMKLFKKMCFLPYKFFANNKKGELHYKVITDTQKLEYIFSQPMYTLLSDVLDLFWISLFIAFISVKALAILIPAIPIIYILSVKTGKLQKKIMTEIQETESSMSAHIDKILSGIETIKVYLSEKREVRYFNEFSKKILKKRFLSTKALSIFFPIEGVIRFVSIFIMLLFCLYEYDKGFISASSLAILFMYANRFYTPITNMNKYYQTFQAGIVSAERIIEIFNEQKEKHDGVKIENNKNNLSIKSQKLVGILSDGKKISYPDLIIDNFKLILVKGESGAGKSSFLKLLLGFIDYEGSIKINNIELKNISKKSLRNLFSYSSQASFLIDDSIKNNIIYPEIDNRIESGNEYLEKIDYLKISENNPNQIFTSIDQVLSGGEKNKISFLRSILCDRRASILDEPFGNLDLDSKKRALDLLKRKMDEKSFICVTHSNNEELNKIADHIYIIN